MASILDRETCKKIFEENSNLKSDDTYTNYVNFFDEFVKRHSSKNVSIILNDVVYLQSIFNAIETYNDRKNKISMVCWFDKMLKVFNEDTKKFIKEYRKMNNKDQTDSKVKYLFAKTKEEEEEEDEDEDEDQDEDEDDDKEKENHRELKTDLFHEEFMKNLFIEKMKVKKYDFLKEKEKYQKLILEIEENITKCDIYIEASSFI
jgi:hypothetical protein